MSLLFRLSSLVGSAKSIQAGISKAQAVAAQVTKAVGTFETASFQENLHKAEQGNVTAQYELGEDYYFGHSAPQDYAEALKWFLRAAELGHKQAQANVGMLYALGRGTKQDYIEGFKWISLAEARGHEGARKTQKTLLGKMTPEQLAEAREKAEEFVAQRLGGRSAP